MAPKVARTPSPCETGEGISTMYDLLNGLHHLGQTSQVPIVVENNMPKEKSVSTVSSERHTASILCFRTSMALIDSTCGYKTIFSCIDIHKPRLPYSFCFLDHFIIIVVCFGINYHDLGGFRINVKDFGRTCGRRLCYGSKDHRANSYTTLTFNEMKMISLIHFSLHFCLETQL
ncbi:unnamed protein product [Malus baccata var. baccata]